jgi:membrane-associated protein
MIDFLNIPEIIALGYTGIFVIVFLESGVFFLLPGDSLLFTVGLLAAAYELDIFFLIPMIFVATFLGGLVGYEIGRNLVKLQRFTFFERIFKDKYIYQARLFMGKYGKLAVPLARFIPIIRTFVPIMAGIANMNYRLFVQYSIVGSALWSFGVTWLGFFLGRIFPEIKDYISFILILIVILSVVPIIREIFRNKWLMKKN